MNKKSASLSLTVLLAVVLAVFTVGVSPANATHVAPILVAGNPSCTTLNADNATFPSITSNFGFKLDGAPTGTFTLTDPPGELTGGAPPDLNNSVTISNVEDLGLGQIFDWAATLGIDAVIVKGGPKANAYVYDPESFGDEDLHAPLNEDGSGKYYGISHIEFCYDYELDVEKTATTTFTRTFNWTIDKSVTPDIWNLFTGDSGTSEYTVDVTKDAGTDSDWAVSGTITIDNNTPFDATITGVTDVVSPAIAASVDCGVGVTFPHTLTSGDTLVCTYSTPLPDGTIRTNTATVTTSGAVGGGEDTVDVTFGAPTTLVNDTINVDDTNGGSWQFSNSGSVSYTKTFTCDGDEGQHDNTATIVETGQSDSASVTVNCFELFVTKDADTSFTRTWEWTIDKSANQTDLLLSEGQLFPVNYEVAVDATSADSDFAVNGNISVYNPAPIAATINSVSDIVSVGIAADVDCGGALFPYTLAPGGTLNCTYSADLLDDADRTNTATATLQNHDYDFEGNATASGTTNFTKTVNVSFANAIVDEVDECIDVNDTNYGFLGTVCADDPLPHTFTYTVWFGTDGSNLGPDNIFVELVCGSNEHPNVADFVTNDTGATGEDNWTVIADVSCDLGCTLTQGYWKTHSEFGPAPYDDTWAQLPDGASTAFFLSGQSWYEVFWTAPAGNAYYILAHQYMAAYLNTLNGASAPAEIQEALDDAEALFNTYTPAQVAAFKGNNATRKQFIALASTLDKYNNGLIGPGHCSE